MKYYKFNDNLRYVKLNFNMARCGKTYYEINKSWKELKERTNLTYKTIKEEIMKKYDEDIKYN